MPLRTRLRRAFTRGSQDEPSGPLSRITSRSSKKDKPKPDPNVYQPGEKMPPMKYRRPVDPFHKKHLESFSWSTSWRRRSEHSVYSPMGSRMPSRKNSFQTLGRRSIGGRKTSSRAGDDIGVDSGFGGSVEDGIDRPELLREGSEEEGDITNVGLSRHPTNDPARKPASIHSRRSQSIRRSHSKRGASRPATKDSAHEHSISSHGESFTPAELELALKRSHLEATKEESDRSGGGTPSSPGEGLKKRNSI